MKIPYTLFFDRKGWTSSTKIGEISVDDFQSNIEIFDEDFWGGGRHGWQLMEGAGRKSVSCLLQNV